MAGLVMVAYPPWTASLLMEKTTLIDRTAGYHFFLNAPPTDDLRFGCTLFPVLMILNPDKPDEAIDPDTIKFLREHLTYRIDVRRLLVHLGILLVGIVGLVWALATRRNASPVHQRED